jgi:phosphate starvation-inducible membrane PsiE
MRLASFLVDAFGSIHNGATTVWSATAAFIGMVAQGRASLADILLLFMYLEILERRSAFISERHGSQFGI